jgi:hypothetical protein
MGFGLKIGLLAAVALLLGHHAYANPCPPGNPPTNCAPPPGAILDLAGTAIPHGAYQQYTTGFTAANATTTISIAFRDDPAFLALDDVSVTTGGGSNLVANPGFESGIVGDSAPVGWVYLNPFVAAPDPFVSDLSNPGPHSGANYYRDGAVDGYNEIAQTISTTPGATYDVSFWLIETSDRINFASVSPAGSSGNGVDLLFYADLGPLATPEPWSLALLGVGLAGLGLLRRRKAA